MPPACAARGRPGGLARPGPLCRVHHRRTRGLKVRCRWLLHNPAAPETIGVNHEGRGVCVPRVPELAAAGLDANSELRLGAPPRLFPGQRIGRRSGSKISRGREGLTQVIPTVHDRMYGGVDLSLETVEHVGRSRSGLGI